MNNIPPIGKPPEDAGLLSSGAQPLGSGQPGEPRYEIRHSDKGIIKGPYFVLIDSEGKVVHESNVYLGGKEEDYEEFCRDGAERELASWIKRGKIK